MKFCLKIAAFTTPLANCGIIKRQYVNVSVRYINIFVKVKKLGINKKILAQ